MSPTPDEATLLAQVLSAEVRRDSLIGPVFQRAFGGDAGWAAARYSWARMLLSDAPPELPPDLDPRAFGRWLALVHGACAALFAPALADALSERAERIAAKLQPQLFLDARDAQ